MTTCFISGFEAADRIKNLIHKDTQLGEDKVYLTVKQIYSLDEKGSLDFGVNENLAPGKTVDVEFVADKQEHLHLYAQYYVDQMMLE